MVESESDRSQNPKRGGTSPVLILLLAGILVALVVLLVVVAAQKPVTTGKSVSSPDGSSIPASSIVRPKLIGDPERIREMLQVGKTYRVVVKAALTARVEDTQWATKQVVNLGYVAEMEAERIIESNDGTRVVERRHFIAARNVKLLSDVESLSIDLGPPGVLALGALGYLKPEAGAVVAVAKPLVEALLKSQAQKTVDSEAIKAVADVNGLTGKTIRITYVDGLGVESVDPVDCTLTAEESDFLKRVAVVSDAYILPNRKSKPDDNWTVDGAALAGFLDPTLNGIPRGEVTVRRDEDEDAGDKRYAKLQITGGSVEIDSSDASTRRMGSFSPRGLLKYSINDGFVENARLKGRIVFERLSRDHILFETSFRSRPELDVSYSCSVR
jgi:hypothetical protein